MCSIANFSPFEEVEDTVATRLCRSSRTRRAGNNLGLPRRVQSINCTALPCGMCIIGLCCDIDDIFCDTEALNDG